MVDTDIDVRTFCDRWLGAWTGNKPEALLEFYTEDTFYLDPAYPAGLNGREELSKYFEKLLNRNPDWKWEAVEIFNTEKGFTLKCKATIPVKGTPLVLYGLDIVEMRAEQICRNEVYFDRVKWLELMKAGGL
jgi:ketosteroid isomerase-like protein